MNTIASLITSLTIVYLTVDSGTDQRKHQSSASLAFVRGIHRRPVNSPHKGPVTRRMFPFDDVIMGYWYPGAAKAPFHLYPQRWPHTIAQVRVQKEISYLSWTELGNHIKSKQGKSEGFDSCDRPSNLTQIGFKSSIFQPMWPWNLMDDLEKNRAPLLGYIKLCASFQSHRWIQTGVTVRKRSIRVKMGDFLSRVTLKFDGWPWKTIGHTSMLRQALCIISKPSVNSN